VPAAVPAGSRAFAASESGRRVRSRTRPQQEEEDVGTFTCRTGRAGTRRGRAAFHAAAWTLGGVAGGVTLGAARRESALSAPELRGLR